METQYLTLGEAARLAPTRPSPNAVWRWCRRGIKSRNGQRVTLKHVRVGGKIFTTAEDVKAFFEKLADADAAHFEDTSYETRPLSKPRTASRRERDITQAESELTRAGL